MSCWLRNHCNPGEVTYNVSVYFFQRFFYIMINDAEQLLLGFDLTLARKRNIDSIQFIR